MAVVMQHGRFSGEQFVVNKGSEGLKITLMSRTGVLPEADFTALSLMNRCPC